jgi:acyl-CoA thioesterase FadM
VPRTVRVDLAVDTSFFTALQLQPRVLLAQSWNALASWYRCHLVPLPELLREHRLGTVIVAIELRYLERLRFFDSDTLTVEAGLTLRRRASRLEQTTTFSAAGRTAARVRTVMCPVAIHEERSLSASPTPMPPGLARRFRHDEVDEAAPARPLPALLESVRAGLEPVGEGEHRFRLAHHHCEVAEQWAFMEVPTLTESAREAIAVDGCAASPVLKRCLAQPMTGLDLELHRPFFVFEQGLVRTEALASRSELAFVHELRSADGRERHGVVVERYG